MYNVRVKRYLDSEQIQVFSEPMLSSGSEREDLRSVNWVTGEICPHNRRVIVTPFEDVPVIGCNMGNEEENIKRSLRRTKSVISDISRSNSWEWFLTLTFDPQKVDSYSYEDTTKKLSQWLNNARKKANDMKYIVVAEKHPTSGRFHFHGLFSSIEELSLTDSSLIDKKGRTIYNVGKYKLGWSTATQIESHERASSYIMKYISKDLFVVGKGKKKYWHSKNCLMPTIEEYFVSMSNEELRRVYDIAAYKKKVYSEYVDVTYLELPIYTTNTTRFLTNEAQDQTQ